MGVVFILALTGALLAGPFLYGFNTAVINTPADSIKLFCVETFMNRNGRDFNKFFMYVKIFGDFPPMQPEAVKNITASPNILPTQLPADLDIQSSEVLKEPTELQATEDIALDKQEDTQLLTSTTPNELKDNRSVTLPRQLLTDSEAQAYICSNINRLPQGSSLTTFWSITVAVYVLGGMVGAFLSGTFADRIGRRNGLLVNQIFSIIGTVCETLAKFVSLPELLPVGRAFVGISCGIGVALGAMYLTEISPRRYRGKVGTSVQLGIVVGILVAQIVGLDIIFGNPDQWPFCFAASFVPIAIAFLTLPCCPESPRFLSISKLNDEAARKAIARLRGDDDAEAELGELLSERNELDRSGKGGNANVSVWKVLSSRKLRLPIFLAIWLYVVQQWSGINAIFSYSETMFKSVQIPSQYIQYAVLSTGVVQILCIFFSIALSEKIGRRRVMIYPTLVMSILMVLFTVMVVLRDVSPVLKYVSLAIFLLYIAAYNLGCGTVPAFFVNEVFKQNSRGSAMTVAQISHWFNSALVVYTFPFTEAAMKEYTYLLYAGILLLSAIVFIIYMPETSGLSVNLLAKMLSFGCKTPIFLLQKKMANEINQDRKRGSRLDDNEDIMMAGRIVREDSDRYS